MAGTNGHLYEFGSFRIDPGRRLLFKDGVPIPVAPKAFDVLMFLVGRSGELVGRDELLKQLWPDTFVEEINLNVQISLLRKVLGEQPNEHRYIVTVPRSGYRFVAEVRQLTNGTKNGADQEQPHTPAVAPEMNPVSVTSIEQVNGETQGSRSWLRDRRTLLLLSILLAAGIVVTFVWIINSRRLANSRAQMDVAQLLEDRQTIRLTNSGQVRRQALSADGKFLAYVLDQNRQQSLWVLQTQTGSSLQIVPPDQVIYRSISISPDGDYVYFTHFSEVVPLFKVPTLGGQVSKVLHDIDSPVAISTDGKQLAFVRNFPETGEISIVVTDQNGTNERILATRKRPNRFSWDGLSWSPDGTHIAVAAEDSDSNVRSMRIVAVRVSDGVEIPVGTQQWSRVEQVVWAGDGKGIVAVAWDTPTGTFGGQIWYAPWPSGPVKRITNDLNNYESVNLSADGSTLSTILDSRTSYFWVEAYGKPGQAIDASSALGDRLSLGMGITWLADGRIIYGKNVGGNIDLWSMDSQGGNQQRLTTSPTADILPTTGDGRSVIYVSSKDRRQHIWTMNSDGSNQRQLTDGDGETEPSVSADGQRMVYSSPSNLPTTMWKKVDGHEAIQVHGYKGQRPAISPDGKWILGGMVADIASTRRQRFTVLPFDGKAEPRTFEPLTYVEQSYVQWAPDSSAFRYLEVRNGVSNIRNQPISGGPSVALTNFESDLVFRFAFSPDGKSLICERGKKVRDLVLLKANLK